MTRALWIHFDLRGMKQGLPRRTAERCTPTINEGRAVRFPVVSHVSTVTQMVRCLSPVAYLSSLPDSAYEFANAASFSGSSNGFAGWCTGIICGVVSGTDLPVATC